MPLGLLPSTRGGRLLLESTDGNRVGDFPMSPGLSLATACRRGSALRIAILGGGMGGLSCAHELARELSEHAGPAEITVYDAAAELGGKARSHYVPGTGTDGRGDLPGEHGFRCYPGFYRHVVETMGEIPDEKSPNGRVSGNLTSCSEAGIARHGRLIVVPRRPRTPMELLRWTLGVYRAGAGVLDMGRYLGAHLKFMTACDARRDGEIEATPWAEFIGADAPGRYREEFRQVILASSRTMSAMDAKVSSSRTIGQASCLLLMDTGEDEVDRTMTGPTTDCWLDPWERALRRQGVRFERGQALDRIELDGRRVARAWIRSRADGSLRPIEADAYILAVPLEVAHALVGRQPELADIDEGFARIRSVDLETTTQWMTGAQYFLSEDVPLAHGHLFLPDSPWSLTAISQAQFWDRGRRGMANYGDGRLRGILSIDVASCFRPDDDGVRLVDARSREEVLERVWRQFLDGVDPTTRRARPLRRAPRRRGRRRPRGCVERGAPHGSPAGLARAAPRECDRAWEPLSRGGLREDVHRPCVHGGRERGGAARRPRRAACGGARGRGRAGVRVPGDQPLPDDAGARRAAPPGGARALLRLGRGGPARVHRGRGGGSPGAAAPLAIGTRPPSV